MKSTNKTKVKIKRKKMSTGRKLFILGCTIIPVINWLVFYVYCNISSVLLAFKDGDQLSLRHFVRIFEEFSYSGSDLQLAFKNTMITFAIILVMYPFQVLVSYFLYKKVPCTGFYRIIFFLPSIIFSVAVALIFKRMVDVEGVIAETVGNISKVGYTPELLADSQFANYTVLFNMIWLSIPGNMVIWGGTFARIPEDVLESGRLDGVNWWGEFTKIIIPLIWPTMALQMVLLFCGMLGASGNVFLLTDAKYGTVTLTSWIYLQLMEISGNQHTSNLLNYMSAVGVVMTVISITISLLVRKFTDKVFTEVEF